MSQSHGTEIVGEATGQPPSRKRTLHWRVAEVIARKVGSSLFGRHGETSQHSGSFFSREEERQKTTLSHGMAVCTLLTRPTLMRVAQKGEKEVDLNRTVDRVRYLTVVHRGKGEAWSGRWPLAGHHKRCGKGNDNHHHRHHWRQSQKHKRIISQTTWAISRLGGSGIEGDGWRHYSCHPRGTSKNATDRQHAVPSHPVREGQ